MEAIRHGAEPFVATPDGAQQRPGVLLCHGMTGSPASLRPWAEHLAEQGHAVRLPRLPGHGTRWQELTLARWPDWYDALRREYELLAEQSEGVVVAGLSMGGALALRLAEHLPVRGVVLVNPSIGADELKFRFVPLLARVLESTSAIGNDIAQAGRDEVAYPRTPLAAVASMLRLWADVRANLDAVQAPVVLFTSRADHVVDPASGRILNQRLGGLVRQHWLDRSYHVATLDYDADFIFAETDRFLQEVGSEPAARRSRR